jgi:hypothetical protein
MAFTHQWNYYLREDLKLVGMCMPGGEIARSGKNGSERSGCCLTYLVLSTGESEVTIAIISMGGHPLQGTLGTP